MEEMKRLQGLRAETLKEACQSQVEMARSDVQFRASPPYFMGSLPVRATNPLVHDAQFCAWKVQGVDQSKGIPIPTKGYNARYCATKGSITKA
ncbi:hypothetical protein C2845_PM09G20760 [Panicum miliaceum]|uniref:Uncharacterized protein n=1 Tax=Panicum miliaceum TaxID=4540 RepID=A0A3L6RXK7_PANMI|nr:hypothetical protein C2845_PM09G20760 [Panicum miliaceum]